MKAVYRFAWKEGDTALYLDISDCKYAAKNGNLAWRINVSPPFFWTQICLNYFLSILEYSPNLKCFHPTYA